MRQHVARGGPHQCGWCFGIDHCGERRCRGGTPSERVQNSSFARLAMGDQPVETGHRIVDLVAMAGVKHPPALGLQASARGHEISKVAVGWRDK